MRVPPWPTGSAEGRLRGRRGEVRLKGGHAAGEVGGRGRHGPAAGVEQPGLAAVQKEGAGGPFGDLQGRRGSRSQFFLYVRNLKFIQDDLHAVFFIKDIGKSQLGCLLKFLDISLYLSLASLLLLPTNYTVCYDGRMIFIKKGLP